MIFAEVCRRIVTVAVEVMDGRRMEVCCSNTSCFCVLIGYICVQIPDSVPTGVRDLMITCWQHERADRPVRNRVVDAVSFHTVRQWKQYDNKLKTWRGRHNENGMILNILIVFIGMVLN
jgi:hypothetical protein